MLVLHRALAKIGAESAPVLVGRLDDSRVRALCLYLFSPYYYGRPERLFKNISPDSVPILVEKLLSRDTETRKTAMWILGEYLGEEPIYVDEPTRLLLLKTFAKIGADAALPLLNQTLQSENTELRRAAAEAIEAITQRNK